MNQPLIVGGPKQRVVQFRRGSEDDRPQDFGLPVQDENDEPSLSYITECARAGYIPPSAAPQLVLFYEIYRALQERDERTKQLEQEVAALKKRLAQVEA